MTPPIPDLQDGTCRTLNPEVWFPHAGDHTAVNAAKTICAACPVLDTCRTWTIAVAKDMYASRQDMQGVWAGLSEQDRQPFLTIRDACGSDAGFQLHKQLRERTCPACRSAHRYVREHGQTVTAARNERRRGHRTARHVAAAAVVSAVAS